MNELKPARSGWPGAGFLLATTLLSLLLLLREPGYFLHPQFWAEDGSVFFMQSYEEGFLRSLITPVSGYLHTFPRLAAGLALLFPLTATPLIFNLAAFAIQALPIPYLLSRRLARYLPNPGLRLLVAALYVAVPNSYETYVNLTNSQWNLTFVGLLILLADRPANRLLQATEAALLAVFSVTGPFGIVLLPCAALNLFEHRRDVKKSWWLAQVAVLTAGAAVQAGILLTAERPTPGGGLDHSLTMAQGLQIISTHVFYDSVLGIQRMLTARWSSDWAALLAGLSLVALLAVFVALQRHRALLWLLYLACVTILLSLLFPLNELKEWLYPGFGPRYYLYATLFMLYATLLLCLRGGRLRWLGIPLALATLTVGIPGDFRHPGRPDTQWIDQVSVFEHLPHGGSFYLPIQPDGWGITMRKRTPGQAAAPLDGLRRLAADPAHAYNRPSFRQTKPPFLKISGWVANTLDNGGTGRVWLVVDERLYPATVVAGRPNYVVVGGEWWSAARDDNASGKLFTGFERLIPVSDLNLGRHQVSLILLTRDGTGYCRTPTKEFSLVRDGQLTVATDVK